MKIFLDDIRDIDDELKFNIVRDYESCISMLPKWRSILTMISLDYSLGSNKTGYDVLVFMSENKIYPKQINIHSDHSEGVALMRQYVLDNFPKETKLTLNRL